MRHVFLLTWTMMRGNGLMNLSGDNRKKRKLLGKVGNTILMLLVAVYFGGLVAAGAHFIYGLLAPAGLQDLLISLFVSATVLMVFFFGVLYVISIFYHSSDVEKLLPLPLTPESIIGAKLIVTAVYEYVFVTLMILPPLIVYGVLDRQPWTFYLISLLVLLLLPLIPLCTAAVLVMLIMRLTPVARNKDRFSMLSGLLSMVVAIGIMYGMQSLGSFSGDALTRMIQTGSDRLASVAASVFPGTRFAVAALTSPSAGAALLQILLLILLTAAILVLTLGVARLVYFKGVIGLSASTARRRAVTTDTVRRSSRQQSSIIVLMRKDLLILIRTPIFFMNNVLMNLIWPVFFLVPLISTGDGLADIRQMAQSLDLAGGGRTAAIVLAVCVAAACFITGTNGISSSALSREGKLIYFMKYLPVSYTRQLWAKVLTGAAMGMVGVLLLFLIALFFLRPVWWYTLLLLAVLPGTILASSLSGIYFDLLWPKLNWDNEQKAVKQNVNVLFGMLVPILLAGLMLGLVIGLELTLMPAALLTLLLPWLLVLVGHQLLRKVARPLLEQIQ